MYIPIYKKVFTTTAKGKISKGVQCEKCGATYRYEMHREGSGTGVAPYGIGSEGAANRSEIAAEKNLAMKLLKQVELVPCPMCHWVNNDMLVKYRTQMYKGGVDVLIGAVMIFTAVTFILMLRLHTHNDTSLTWAPMACLLGAVVSVGLVAVRIVLRMKFNPNAGHRSA